MSHERNGDFISADVLVLGGGLGGCFAAIKAAEEGCRVVLFEKAHIQRSGSNATGIHRMPLIHPDYNYSYEEFAMLNVEAGAGLVDEDVSYAFAEDTFDRIRDLESWGLKVRNDDGSFTFMPGKDICPGNTVIWPPGPGVWRNIKPLLANKVLSYPNIQVCNRTAAIGLLTEDGIPGTRVVGALGLETRTGKFIVCEARTTILTSGNSHRLGRHADTTYAPTRFITVPPPSNCAEGQAMAYRAGADLINMEFGYLARIWKDFAHAGVGATSAVGGALVGTGQEVKYNAFERYKRTHTGAFHTEGPLYADVSKAEGWPEEKGTFQQFIWGFENECTSAAYLLWLKERGEDFRKGPVETEWRSLGIHNNQPGVHMDPEARGSLEGLYCAGDVMGGGWRHASGGAMVFGTKAGRNGAAYARTAPEPKIHPEQVAREKNRIIEASNVNPCEGYSWIELEDKARRIASDYGPPFTNDALLKRGIAHLDRIRTNYLPKLYARNPREIMRVSEVKAIFFAVEAFLKASLFRKESRHSSCTILYKTDYPERDDKNWLKHTLIRNVGGEMTLGTKEVKRIHKNK